MTKGEQELLKAISELSVFLHNDSPFWADLLLQRQRKAEGLFVEESPLEERFDFVKNEIERLFGGMGSLTDFNLSSEGECLREALYRQTRNLLRDYWKELGRESHDPQEFKLHKVGAKVRLVRDEIFGVCSDGRSMSITDEDLADGATWTVLKQCPPDITNMPLYIIQHGKWERLVRHGAIEPVKRLLKWR
jgi:hypothetical protein